MATERADELNCAKCGACAVVCPVFRVDGREVLTARGRMHLLSTDPAQSPSSFFEEIFSRCLLCTACEQVCPRHLPITDLISQARSSFSPLYGPNGLKKNLACAALNSPRLLAGLAKAGISLQGLHVLPVHSGLRLKLGLLEKQEDPALSRNKGTEMWPQKKQATASLSYFTGCFARHIQPSILAATQTLLSTCKIPAAHIPQEQHCCGLAAWSTGKREQARELARKNIRAFSGTKGPIISSCASCSSHLLAYPKLFSEHDPCYSKAVAFTDRVREFTTFFDAELSLSPCTGKPSRQPEQRIFYHDPCHLRFRDKGMSAPRSLLKKIGVHILEPEKGPRCCGQGGLFHIACPEDSAKIFQKSSEQALSDSPDCITSTCSACLMQFQEGTAQQGRQIRVVHLAILLADCLAPDSPDLQE